MHPATWQQEGRAAVLRDRALPQLDRAQDPALVAPRLAALLGEHGALRVRVLKHVAGKRCVLGFEHADGTRAIAKVYRKERAVRQAAALAGLGDALQGGTRVPRLLACWDDWGLVLQEWVPGMPVPDYERLGGESALVDRLAAGLAEFHAAPVTCGAPADLAAHVRRTCGTAFASLATEWPEMAGVAHELERAIYARAARAAADVRTCHGDFGPRQVLVDGARVYLVDLDGLCRSDAAFDVASFRVGLETHLGAAGRALGERFLAEYLVRRRLTQLPALTAYEAFCDLRRALIVWRKRPPDWEAELRACMDRGRARL